MRRVLTAMALAVTLCCGAGKVCAQDQAIGAHSTPPLPPMTRPEGCPPAVVDQLDRAGGTAVYRSLHREIAALRLGHEASDKLQAALGAQAAAPGGDSAGVARRQVVQVMTSMDKAHDEYLCGAFIASAGGGDPAVDGAVRNAVVPALQRMAAEVSRLENSVVSHTAGNDAEPAEVILEERRQTGANLLDGVAQSQAAAVEGDVLRMSCAERARLIGELGGWSKGADEFTAAAGLMQEFLRRVQQCGAS